MKECNSFVCCAARSGNNDEVAACRLDVFKMNNYVMLIARNGI